MKSSLTDTFYEKEGIFWLQSEFAHSESSSSRNSMNLLSYSLTYYFEAELFRLSFFEDLRKLDKAARPSSCLLNVWVGVCDRALDID